MTKTEFLAQLQAALQKGGYSEEEAAASCDFYAELMDDRCENGAQEEEVIADFGDIDTIAEQILTEQPPKATEEITAEEEVREEAPATEEAAQTQTEEPQQTEAPKEEPQEPKDVPPTKQETGPSTMAQVLYWCSVPFWAIPLAILVVLLAVFVTGVAVLFVCAAVLPLAFGAGTVLGIVLTPYLFTQNVATAIAFIGASLFLAGLTVLCARPVFYYCRVLWHCIVGTFRILIGACKRRPKRKKKEA